MEAWGVVERDYEINVFDSTWVLILKKSDMLMNKFKIQLYDRGDHQLEGLYFFETYDPFL